MGEGNELFTEEYVAIFTGEKWMQWRNDDISPDAYLQFNKNDGVSLDEMR